MSIDARSSIRVVAAVIVGDRGCLATRRGPTQSHAGQWELPGGKVEAGETPEAALARELHEELGITVQVGRWIGQGRTSKGETEILVDAYLARIQAGAIRLAEHADWGYFAADRLAELDWCEADRQLLPALVALLKQG